MMTIHLNANGLSSLNSDIRYLIQPDIFKEDILVRAMQEIEHVHTIEGLAFYSSDYGVKSPESLSNGMKALILLTYAGQGKFGELVSNSCMGANCGPFLQELSLKYDFDIAWDCFLALNHDAPLAAKDSLTGQTFYKGDDLLVYYRGRAHL